MMAEVEIVDISVDPHNLTQGVYDVLSVIRPKWKQCDIEIKVSNGSIAYLY